jgi:hypothetical protein
MRKALEFGEPGARELDFPLHPTRSGRSLEHREASPIERRQERREASEIAALKARVEQQTAIESQCKVARQEVEAQKLARAGDAARAAERIALLESHVEMAASHAMRAVAAISKQRNAWRMAAAIAGIAALSFLGIALWLSSAAGPQIVPQVPQQPASSKVRGVRTPLPQDAPAALTTALERLNGALEIVPNRAPEEALRSASATVGCAIVWTNELPSVVFAPRGPNSIAMTLDHCAEAVEDLR